MNGLMDVLINDLISNKMKCPVHLLLKPTFFIGFCVSFHLKLQCNTIIVLKYSLFQYGLYCGLNVVIVSFHELPSDSQPYIRVSWCQVKSFAQEDCLLIPLTLLCLLPLQYLIEMHTLQGKQCSKGF